MISVSFTIIYNKEQRTNSLFSDAITVVGISTISGIPAVAGLPSAVDVCDVPAAAAVDNDPWMKEVKGIRHGGGGAYLRCPVFTTVQFSLRDEGSSEYIRVWRTMTVCYVTITLTPSGLNLCQIVKTVHKK
jgi:hypothetical protein